MSTRGLYGFKLDGLYRLSYHFSDSYPDYLGVGMAKQWTALRERYGDDLKAKARSIRLLANDTRLDRRMIEALQQFTLVFEITPDSAPLADDPLNMTHPERLLEALAGKGEVRSFVENSLNQLLANFAIGAMFDCMDFAADSLFCEWAYAIDLDDDVLEIYAGRIDQPHEVGPFAHMPKANEKYHPIRQICRLPYETLAGDWVEAVDQMGRSVGVDCELAYTDISAHRRMELIRIAKGFVTQPWSQASAAQHPALEEVPCL